MECVPATFGDSSVPAGGSVAVAPAFVQWPFGVLFAWGGRRLPADDALHCRKGRGTSTLNRRGSQSRVFARR